MDKIIDQLWYIIPGALLILPFCLGVIHWPLAECSLQNGISFATIAFVVGYMVHQIWRLIFYKFFLTQRPLIRYFKNRITKENFQDDGFVDDVYNQLYYSNEKFKSLTAHIDKKFNFCTSAGTAIVASILAFFLISYSISTNLSYFLIIIPAICITVYHKSIKNKFDDSIELFTVAFLVLIGIYHLIITSNTILLIYFLTLLFLCTIFYRVFLEANRKEMVLVESELELKKYKTKKEQSHYWTVKKNRPDMKQVLEAAERVEKWMNRRQ